MNNPIEGERLLDFSYLIETFTVLKLPLRTLSWEWAGNVKIFKLCFSWTLPKWSKLYHIGLKTLLRRSGGNLPLNRVGPIWFTKKYVLYVLESFKFVKTSVSSRLKNLLLKGTIDKYHEKGGTLKWENIFQRCCYDVD